MKKLTPKCEDCPLWQDEVIRLNTEPGDEKLYTTCKKCRGEVDILSNYCQHCGVGFGDCANSEAEDECSTDKITEWAKRNTIPMGNTVVVDYYELLGFLTAHTAEDECHCFVHQGHGKWELDCGSENKPDNL